MLAAAQLLRVTLLPIVVDRPKPFGDALAFDGVEVTFQYTPDTGAPAR